MKQNKGNKFDSTKADEKGSSSINQSHLFKQHDFSEHDHASLNYDQGQQSYFNGSFNFLFDENSLRIDGDALRIDGDAPLDDPISENFSDQDQQNQYDQDQQQAGREHFQVVPDALLNDFINLQGRQNKFDQIDLPRRSKRRPKSKEENLKQNFYQKIWGMIVSYLNKKIQKNNLIVPEELKWHIQKKNEHGSLKKLKELFKVQFFWPLIHDMLDNRYLSREIQISKGGQFWYAYIDMVEDFEITFDLPLTKMVISHKVESFLPESD